MNHIHDQSCDQIFESTIPVLEILKKHNISATFAVLGEVAFKYPELIKYIHDEGHEIASHGYSHRMLNELSPSIFESELYRSLDLLENITSEPVIGYMAPSFSLNNSTIWVLEILSRHGIKYDSSVFPIKTFLYGEPKAPLEPYKISFSDVTQVDINSPLIEFPMTAIHFGINIPVAGGFYHRLYPYKFMKYLICTVNKNRPAIVYLHPWEMYVDTPRIKSMPVLHKLIDYYGISKAKNKFERLLCDFDFLPVKYVLMNSGFSV